MTIVDAAQPAPAGETRVSFYDGKYTVIHGDGVGLYDATEVTAEAVRVRLATPAPRQYDATPAQPNSAFEADIMESNNATSLNRDSVGQSSRGVDGVKDGTGCNVAQERGRGGTDGSLLNTFGASQGSGSQHCESGLCGDRSGDVDATPAQPVSAA